MGVLLPICRPPLYFAFALCVLAFLGVLRFVRESRPLHSDAVTFPNIGAVISHASAPERQGEMLGLNMAAMALARIIGPLVAAPLFALHIGGPSPPPPS